MTEYGYKPLSTEISTVGVKAVSFESVDYNEQNTYVNITTGDKVVASDIIADFMCNRSSSMETRSLYSSINNLTSSNIRYSIMDASKRKRASIRRNRTFTNEKAIAIITECKARITHRSDYIFEYVPTFTRKRK